MINNAEFFEKVRIIYGFACRYGVDKFRIEIGPNVNEHSYSKFVQVCHEGFALAQDQILEGLITCEREHAELTVRRKALSSKRDKDDSKSLLQRIQILDYQAQILRKLADSIAWQMVLGDHYIIRRLFLGERAPSLLSAGLAETRAQANKLNLDKQGFALISDVTSFIQVGDIFHSNGSGYKIIEVKSGKKNEEAISILQKWEKEPSESDVTSSAYSLEPKMRKQVERMRRQYERIERAERIIDHGQGTDPKTGHGVSIFEASNDPDTYVTVIKEIIEESKFRMGAYALVEGIVHIGAYRGVMRLGEGKLIEAVVKMQTGKTFPVYNYVHSMNRMICEPLFLKDFSEPVIFELLSEEIGIYMSIDYDAVARLFKESGYNVSWSSKKEFHSIRARFPAHRFIGQDNRLLRIDIGEKKSYIGDGLIARIIGDNLLPSVAVKSVVEILEKEINKKRED